MRLGVPILKHFRVYIVKDMIKNKTLCQERKKSKLIAQRHCFKLLTYLQNIIISCFIGIYKQNLREKYDLDPIMMVNVLKTKFLRKNFIFLYNHQIRPWK